MREHKYRAWNKENKTMYEIDGNDLYIADNRIYEINISGDFNGELTVYKTDVTDQYILMEYVGFKDMNKKEIYEGDIDSGGYVVTYQANLNVGLGMNAGWYLQRDNFESWSVLECNDDIEIVGNVFENPEKAINNCNTDCRNIF